MGSPHILHVYPFRSTLGFFMLELALSSVSLLRRRQSVVRDVVATVTVEAKDGSVPGRGLGGGGGGDNLEEVEGSEEALLEAAVTVSALRVA